MPRLKPISEIGEARAEDHAQNGRSVDYLSGRRDFGDYPLFLAEDTRQGQPGLAKVRDLLARLSARDPDSAADLASLVRDRLPEQERKRLFAEEEGDEPDEGGEEEPPEVPEEDDNGGSGDEEDHEDHEDEEEEDNDDADRNERCERLGLEIKAAEFRVKQAEKEYADADRVWKNRKEEADKLSSRLGELERALKTQGLFHLISMGRTVGESVPTLMEYWRVHDAWDGALKRAQDAADERQRQQENRDAAKAEHAELGNEQERLNC